MQEKSLNLLHINKEKKKYKVLKITKTNFFSPTPDFRSYYNDQRMIIIVKRIFFFSFDYSSKRTLNISVSK